LKGPLVKQFNARTIKSTTAARTPLLGSFLFPFFRSLALICIWNSQPATGAGLPANWSDIFYNQGNPELRSTVNVNCMCFAHVWICVCVSLLSAVNCQQKFCSPTTDVHFINLSVALFLFPPIFSIPTPPGS